MDSYAIGAGPKKRRGPTGRLVVNVNKQITGLACQIRHARCRGSGAVRLVDATHAAGEIVVQTVHEDERKLGRYCVPSELVQINAARFSQSKPSLAPGRCGGHITQFDTAGPCGSHESMCVYSKHRLSPLSCSIPMYIDAPV